GDLLAPRIPSIVIASSGMATGGRVLRHLDATLPNPKNTILFVGYQAAGTRGPSLAGGRAEGGWAPGPGRTGRRPRRANRFDVGARRRRRDPAVVVGFHTRAAH